MLTMFQSERMPKVASFTLYCNVTAIYKKHLSHFKNLNWNLEYAEFQLRKLRIDKSSVNMNISPKNPSNFKC